MVFCFCSEDYFHSQFALRFFSISSQRFFSPYFLILLQLAIRLAYFFSLHFLPFFCPITAGLLLCFCVYCLAANFFFFFCVFTLMKYFTEFIYSIYFLFFHFFSSEHNHQIFFMYMRVNNINSARYNGSTET